MRPIKRPGLWSALLALAVTALLRAATPPASPTDEAVLMKPFVITAAEVTVRVKWLTDRATRTPRVLLLQIDSVHEGSAAYAAGLRVNMVVDAIDGRRVEDRTREELTKIVNRPRKKDSFIELTVLQGLEKKKIRFPVDDSVEVKR